MKRLAPGLEAGAVLAEVRERISDELDYEIEAQHQRRLERRFRGHPHVRLARVHTDLCTRRVLVTEFLGLRPAVRRVELQVLTVLGELHAGADWGAIAAEHHAAEPPATELGREDRAFFARR